MDVRLEIERPLHPGEKEIHCLFDLPAHVLMQLFTRERVLFDEQLADALVAGPRLRGNGALELLLRDHAVLHQQVTEAVPAIDDRRVADAPFLEEDVAEVAPVRHREATRLLPHRKELKDVGEAGLLQGALNGHGALRCVERRALCAERRP